MIGKTTHHDAKSGKQRLCRFQVWRALAVAGCLLAIGASWATAEQLRVGTMATKLIEAFDGIFGGMHPQARAVHAKGVVLLGSFAPAPAAASLSRAVHLNGGVVPIIVRFSNFSGVPAAADAAPDANPRGMAVRFQLPNGITTDIVVHSYDGFPAATPEEFLGFLHAAAAPETMPAFAALHPAAQAFLAAPKPVPASYATQTYYGVNAFRFTNAARQSRYGRYRLVPVAGESDLTPEQAADKPKDFLVPELADRLANGPIQFRLIVQLAGAGDDVENGSIPWPSERPTVELGTLTLRTLAPAQKQAQQALRFRPTSLVGGIAPSKDPMLLARTYAYRASADRRSGSE